jgi:type IV pilus assembly protein PilX
MRATAFRHRQRGAALLVGLVFLVLVSLIAVTALGSTVLQERMTGGQRNESLAFNGSESALRGAERALWDRYVETNGTGVPSGTVEAEAASARSFRDASGWVASGEAYAEIDYDKLAKKAGGGRLDRDPRYVIENLSAGSASAGSIESHTGNYGEGSLGVVTYFRVTARSTGGDARVVRAAESVYAMSR